MNEGTKKNLEMPAGCTSSGLTGERTGERERERRDGETGREKESKKCGIIVVVDVALSLSRFLLRDKVFVP